MIKASRPQKSRINLIITFFTLFLSILLLNPVFAEEQENTINALKKISDGINIAKEEYRESVADGKIIMAEEYEEATLFVAQAQKNIAALATTFSDKKAEYDSVLNQINIIAEQIKTKANPEIVITQVLQTDEAIENLAGTTLKEFPGHAPMLTAGKKVFETNCASCHGTTGLGDGPAAVNMEPKPVNFLDKEYMDSKSPYAFYRAIKNGIAGTDMPAWEYTLTLEEKWAVISYIRSFMYKEESVANGKAVYDETLKANQALAAKLSDITYTADKSNIQLVEEIKPDPALAGVAETKLEDMVNYIRAEKTVYKATTDGQDNKTNLTATITEIRALLALSKQNYLADKSELATENVVSAYMTFEPVEKELGVKDNALARSLELKFNQLKGLYAAKGNEAKVNAVISEINEGLDEAFGIMTAAGGGMAVLLQSMAIILREGFEAIIIIVALISFTRKSENGKPLAKNIYYGVGLGIAASFVTAFIIETLLNNSSFSKEVIEGATILIAAAMLFYVSHWLISKTQADKWQQFIKSQLSSALNKQSSFALALVGFLAVYREGFETILFYKALFTTTTESSMITAGFLSGSVILAVISLLFYKFSIRIPIREFFIFTGLILYYMVFSFAGKGINELQEANLIGATGVPLVPTIDLLGIYPTVETLLAQAFVVIAWLAAVLYSFKSTGVKTEVNPAK